MQTTPQGDPVWTPQDQRLPADLVERVSRVLRHVGLPLAHENDDVGVFLTRGDGQPMNAPEPADHVALSWHTPPALFDAADQEGGGGPTARLMCAVDDAMEATLREVLAAAGLHVAPHPATETLAVWPAPPR
ncbi:hypothetical protein SAMN06297387_107186 [Streptomyces zhaozhouensis]|uniref:Uncharacterized protein n=1 Tax=Streptomyces zhaozhouensis TaxID=1300267 RepID=A0A286DVX9_9ACTN|nr:hypothetical protein [Streptomyces zhaozhouensis]SOD62812.1 hypothetical protein SAMN06297387_107186 [Streptomyces zhaozhouensis]